MMCASFHNRKKKIENLICELKVGVVFLSFLLKYIWSNYAEMGSWWCSKNAFPLRPSNKFQQKNKKNSCTHLDRTYTHINDHDVMDYDFISLFKYYFVTVSKQQ